MSSYTSLVRAGDKIDSLGTISLENKGNIESDFTALITGDTTEVFKIVFDNEDETKSTSSDIGYKYAGKDYKLQLNVQGNAGDIIDLDGVKVSVTNQHQDDHEETELSGKNLVTYQADINYDGRVSMTDLAYLNAGAAIDNYGNDVDVNYDGRITMDDLAMMDKEWGSSLHTKALINDSFTGTDDKTIDLGVDDLGNGNQTNNSSFIEQNEIEQLQDFVGSLAQAGSQGYIDTTIEEGMSPDDAQENAIK